ncbi:MAG: HDOD domain-containing protein [Gammaproteobacteria bacterium]|nr:HDOD domain-containing protein [Gammaproteobacteria bacterium]
MDVNALITDATRVVSLPSTYLRLTEILNKPSHTAQEIAKLIEQDPGLSVRLLKIANSAAYGLSRKVDSISRAVTLLGNDPLRDLVLSTQVVDSFDGIPNDLVTMQDFWYHSIACAIGSKYLAQRAKIPDADSAFIAGLLHDIGQLVMFNALPEQSRQSLLMSIDDELNLEHEQCERQLIGFDHAELGAALAQKWNLPELLQEAIACHHQPEQAKNHPRLVAAVHIANILAVLAEIRSTNPEDAAPIHPAAWKTLGLNPVDTLGEAINYIRENVASLQSLLSGR